MLYEAFGNYLYSPSSIQRVKTQAKPKAYSPWGVRLYVIINGFRADYGWLVELLTARFYELEDRRIRVVAQRQA